MALKHDVKRIFLVVHDLTITGNIIPINDRIKAIFCMSEWHKTYFSSIFPTLNNIKVFPNGIHYTNRIVMAKKINSFIYSSFPNRGLLHLLRMFPTIKEVIIDATLDIFCDMDNAWSNNVAKEEMEEIKLLLVKHKNFVTNYGFVKKEVLYQHMAKCEVMLYPCTFQETFCISLLEAKMHGVICLTNDLGAIKNVSDTFLSNLFIKK